MLRFTLRRTVNARNDDAKRDDDDAKRDATRGDACGALSPVWSVWFVVVCSQSSSSNVASNATTWRLVGRAPFVRRRRRVRSSVRFVEDERHRRGGRGL